MLNFIQLTQNIYSFFISPDRYMGF